MTCLALGCELATSGLPIDCSREVCQDADAGTDPPPVDLGDDDAGEPPAEDAGTDGGLVDCSTCPGDDDDLIPPTFNGAEDTEELSDTECAVEWKAASDDRSAPDEIVYEVFVGDGNDRFDFARPVAITEPGALAQVVVLRRRERRNVIVRAVDSAGNRDANVRARTCDLR